VNERARNPPRKFSTNNEDIDDSWRGYLEGEALICQSLAENLDLVERLDRMTALAEARRFTVLREIERHQAMLAERLRWSLPRFENAAKNKLIEQRPQQQPSNANGAA
jgi:hypothetical protein